MLRLLLFLLLLIHDAVACGQDSLILFKQTRQLMGTTFTLSYYAKSTEQGQLASEKAFDRVGELNNIFSDYQEDSEISRLAKNAPEWTSVSKDLWLILKLSKKISRQSEGAFDITVGPLTKLWRRAIRQNQFPDSIDLAEARKLVNYRWIKFRNRRQQVRLLKPGMKLDFGAIAKGYAVDQAFKELEKCGITMALVDGGGDLYLGQHPPGKTWDIKDHLGDPLTVSGFRGIASSGDSYQNLAWQGARYSHIVNPSSGIGLKDSHVVTVVAPNATLADALASALSVMGPQHAEKLKRKFQFQIIRK